MNSFARSMLNPAALNKCYNVCVCWIWSFNLTAPFPLVSMHSIQCFVFVVVFVVGSILPSYAYLVLFAPIFVCALVLFVTI